MMSSRADVDEQLIGALSTYGAEGLDPMTLAAVVGFEEKKHVMGRIHSLKAAGRIERVPGNGPQKWRVCLAMGPPSAGNVIDYSTDQSHFNTNQFPPFGNMPFRGHAPRFPHPQTPPYQQPFPPRGHSSRAGGRNHRGGGPRNGFRGRGGYSNDFNFSNQQWTNYYQEQPVFEQNKAFNNSSTKGNQHHGIAAGQPQTGGNHIKEETKQSKRKSAIKVSCPGEAGFISYKNTLQEFAQKQHFTVPCYNIKKADYGFSGSVSLAGIDYQCGGIKKDRKQAEQNAAFEALKALNLIPSSSTFICSAAPSQGPVPKKAKIVSNFTSYKSQLNEFCQKFHLPIPSYETVQSGNGYISTLVYNKKVYQSNSIQPTKKDAEQNGAQVVLAMLNQCSAPDIVNRIIGSGESPIPPTVVQEEQAIEMLSQKEQATDPGTPVMANQTSFKNRLQEYCQKRKMNLPMYETIRGSGGLFVSTVNVQEQNYAGQPCKVKKAAEQSAAEAALAVLPQST